MSDDSQSNTSEKMQKFSLSRCVFLYRAGWHDRGQMIIRIVDIFVFLNSRHLGKCMQSILKSLPMKLLLNKLTLNATLYKM